MKKLQFILQVEFDPATRWQVDQVTLGKLFKAAAEIQVDGVTSGAMTPAVKVVPVPTPLYSIDSL